MEAKNMRTGITSETFHLDGLENKRGRGQGLTEESA